MHWRSWSWLSTPKSLGGMGLETSSYLTRPCSGDKLGGYSRIRSHCVPGF
jgi:hypothetical protein